MHISRKFNIRDIKGLFYVMPAVILVFTFFMIPLGMTIWMSFHRWPLIGRIKWVGLSNYQKLFSDAAFGNALLFTIKYTIVITIILLVVSLWLAMMIEKPKKGVAFYRTAYFLPVVIGFASASLLWAWFSQVDSGLFSPLMQKMGFTEKRINILGEYNWAFWSIILMVVWKMAGFYMVIFMSALQSVPKDYHEAASLDGVKAWQRFGFITFPLVKRSFALALILCVSGSMLAFDQFYIILNGGPQNKTITAVYWIFNQSFVSFKLGYGSALSVVLLVILMMLSLIQLWLLREDRD